MTDQEQSPSDWPPRIVVCVGAVVLQGERALLEGEAEGLSPWVGGHRYLLPPS